MLRVFVLAVLLASVAAPVQVSAHTSAPSVAATVHSIDDARHAADRVNFGASTKPIIPRALVPRSNPPLRREVFGFAPYWNLSLNAEWNYSLLSTVAYFGLDVNADGTFATQGSGWNGWISADLTNMINRAHAAGDRVVLVIKDFRDDSINYVVTNSRANLISQTIAAIASKNLDGVNVDFEPSGSSLFPDIPLGIVNLMTEMSAAVHAKWPQDEVSIDTYAGAASWDGGSFRIGDLAPVVDAFFIMAYDSVFANMPGQAGPNAPLNGWTFNDTVDVQQYLTKAPASKIILGVPYYGYKWSTVDASLHSTTVSGATAETYSDVIGDLTCGHVALQRAWDPVGQSPWASWWSPPSGDPCGSNLGYPRELYYDDPTSLGLKYDLVNNNNLRGAGMWALGYDSGYSDLWNVLALKFTPVTAWTALGGKIDGGPDAASWGGSRKDVFVRGIDDQLWQRTWNGSVWSSWIPLGGVLTADPTAVSWGPGRIDVFVRGTDNGLWHRSFTASGGWYNWESLGGVLTSGPDAASWGAGRLDVFVRGTDNGLWHRSFTAGGGWYGWEAMGGGLSSDPGAVSSGLGRIDVFARGSDYALWHRSFTAAGGWFNWESLGGWFVSAPDAASCSAGHVDVFVLGSDSSVHRLGNGGAGFGTWQPLGGLWTSNPGAVCSPGATSVDLFARGPDGVGIWTTSVPAS